MKNKKNSNIVLMPLFALFIIMLSVAVFVGITKINSNQEQITNYKGEISLMSRIKLEQDSLLNKESKIKIQESVKSTYFNLDTNKEQTVTSDKDKTGTHLINSKKEIETAFDEERLKDIFYYYVEDEIKNKKDLDNNQLVLRNLESDWFFSLVDNKYVVGKTIDNFYFTYSDIFWHNMIAVGGNNWWDKIINKIIQKEDLEDYDIIEAFLNKLDEKEINYNENKIKITLQEALNKNPYMLYPALKEICNELSSLENSKKLNIAQQLLRTVQMSAKENPTHKACFEIIGELNDGLNINLDSNFLISDSVYSYRPMISVELETPFNEVFDLEELKEKSKELMVLEKINEENLEKIIIEEVPQPTINLKNNNNEFEIKTETSPTDATATPETLDEEQIETKEIIEKSYTWYFKKIDENNEIEFEGCFDGKWDCNDGDWRSQDCKKLKNTNMDSEYLYVCVMNNNNNYATRFALRLGEYKLGTITDFTAENAQKTQQTAKLTFKIEDGTIDGVYVGYWQDAETELTAEELQKEENEFENIIPIDYIFEIPKYESISIMGEGGIITYTDFPTDLIFEYNQLYKSRDETYTLFFYDTKLEIDNNYNFAIMPFIIKDKEEVTIRERETEAQIEKSTAPIQDTIPPKLTEHKSLITKNDLTQQISIKFCKPKQTNMDGQTVADDIGSYHMIYGFYDSCEGKTIDELTQISSSQSINNIFTLSFTTEEEYKEAILKKLCYLIYAKDEKESYAPLYTDTQFKSDMINHFIFEQDLTTPSLSWGTLIC